MATTLTSTGVLYNDGTTITNSVTATRAIFGYGFNGSTVNVTNLFNNYGDASTNTTGVGTARYSLAAASYGGDKAIFGYGTTTDTNFLSMTNLVSYTGVTASDTTGVGTPRHNLAAAGYGNDKAIFGFGLKGTLTSDYTAITNLVSSAGIVASDQAAVTGTARKSLAAAGYGNDKAIFGYGHTSSVGISTTNLVSNTGVVAGDTSGVGSARISLAAASYGYDKAIFGYGLINYPGPYNATSITNLVSNTGVVSSDVTGVGTARQDLAAAGYGGDKAVFAYGGGYTTLVNKVSNSGVVSTDTTGAGTGRSYLAAASYSS